MKIVSWNVNGIRAVMQKGFFERIQSENPDIICLQEAKAFEYQLPAEMRYAMQDYVWVWHAGQKPGYAGVVTFYKKYLSLHTSRVHFEDTLKFHEDGRVVETDFGDFVLLNVYFPNGGDRADGTEMLSYKLSFYDEMLAYLDALVAKGRQVIITGDFNICHRPIDIARPKENEHSIGFLPEERAKMDELLAHGYVDVFRAQYPDLAEQYTWRSYRAGARPRNVGWRLDYFWVNAGFLAHVKSVAHQTQVMGSDHCPIILETI